MFNWFKKRRAYRLGRKAGGMICEEIENHITARVIPASQRFIDVFRERLTTIWDEPPSPPNPRVRLHNEWGIFKENLDKFIAERRAGIIHTYKFDEAIDPIRTDVNDYISHRMGTIESEMFAESEPLIHQAISEIKRRESGTTNGL